MVDPHARLRDELLNQVLHGPGDTEPSLREAVAADADLPADLRPFVDKIHAHAYRITDSEVAALQGAHGDDELFEIVVSAALGASRKRLLAGLRALEDA